MASSALSGSSATIRCVSRNQNAARSAEFRLEYIGRLSTKCPTVASRHCCEMVSAGVRLRCDPDQPHKRDEPKQSDENRDEQPFRGERTGLETGSSTFSEDMSEVPCHDPTGSGPLEQGNAHSAGRWPPAILPAFVVADSTRHRRTEFQIRPRFRDGFGNPSYVRYAISRCRNSAAHSSLWTRHCCKLSRSRIVTVPSSSVWLSTVMQNGVPTSSWRR